MSGIRLGGVAVIPPPSSPPYTILTLPGYYNIWRVLNGVPVEMIGDSADINDIRIGPELSPDGTKIVMSHGTGGGFLEVWVYDADGSNPTYIDGAAGGNEYAMYPSWSPDGSKVIYTWNDQSSSFGGEIRTANPDGTGITTLWTAPLVGPGGGAGAARRPRYSSDGTKIAFKVADDGVGGSPEYGAAEIWVMDADGSNDGLIVTLINDPFDQCQFSWANNSNVIAYYEGNLGGTIGEIKKINADGTGDTDLSQSGGVGLKTISDLAWAPDDSQVFWTLYESQDQGLAHYIHVAEADGSGDTLLDPAHAAGVLNNTLHSVWVYDNYLWFFPDNAGVSFRDQLGAETLAGTDFAVYHDLDDTDADLFYDETGFEHR